MFIKHIDLEKNSEFRNKLNFFYSFLYITITFTKNFSAKKTFYKFFIINK